MERFIGVSCKSGRKAAIGVSIHMSYVGSMKRPTPEEFEELVQNARNELSKDEFWDSLLKDIRQYDEAERKNYLMKQEDTANADV